MAGLEKFALRLSLDSAAARTIQACKRRHSLRRRATDAFLLAGRVNSAFTSANCLSAPRRKRLPVSRGGPEPATRAIRKNLARALALPVVAGAASRFEPLRKLMAFDRIRVGLVAGTVGAAILGGCYFIFSSASWTP